MKNPFEQQQTLSGIRHIIAVGSGKGGVGKSTVALNLALALKHLGQSTGLMDADFYGPSIPLMTGTHKQKMTVHQDKLIPMARYGLKIASIGYLIDPHSAVIWRGPMLFKAVEQFLRDVDWGNLDYLIVDLPPGTGDVALTLAQKTPISGGVAVCTPQSLALADMIRAVKMFHEIQIPLLGVVENMSCFHAENMSEPVYLFPKGQLSAYLKEHQIDKLGEIPFYPDIGLCAESGIPSLESSAESEESQVFINLAQKILQKTAKKDI